MEGGSSDASPRERRRRGAKNVGAGRGAGNGHRELTTTPKPAIPPVQGRQTKGRVAELSYGRSCGVIRSNDGQRVFFHSRDLEGSRYNEVEIGASVFFELIADPVSGPRAARVRVTVSQRCL